MEDEQWEALDVDDSEIPFLRPCKRQNHSVLAQPNPSSSPVPFLIPGPAGAVQSAMQRKARGDGSYYGARDEDPIPTQEYIRRVLENGDVRDDDDFRANSWVSALDFLRKKGTADDSCTILGTPLSSIKNGLLTDRVARVVAIVKSCTPNGLGGLMVTLKDPTGTIGASIHRKVLSEGEFGKNISIGTVLILQKVAVFAPLRSAFYLNITLNNVVKVISKDSGSPIEQNYAPSLRYAAENSESNGTSHISEPVISQKRTEGIMNNLTKDFEIRGSLNKSRVVDIPEKSSFSNEECRNRDSIGSAEKESSHMGRVGANGISNTTVLGSKLSNDDEVIVTDEQPSLCEPSESDTLRSSKIAATITTENLVEVPGDKEPDMEFGSEKMRELAVSRTSIPDWTDEQLDLLSAFDD